MYMIYIYTHTSIRRQYKIQGRSEDNNRKKWIHKSLNADMKALVEWR